ncbi:MAG: amidohydrolase family protein [Lentisphaeria bacterium]|nr:amidohydrolase family protein [Lentisphaeria bacterium]
MTECCIDTHAHLRSDYDPRVFEKIQADGIIKQLWLLAHECHVETAAYHPATNKQVLEAAKLFPEFILPFGYINWRKGPEQIEELKNNGFFGLKAIRPIHNYNDLRYFPLYEMAEKLDMPILFHVGIIARRRREELTDPELCAGPDKMRPSFLDSIAAAFPKLKIIQGHMGVPWCNELFESLWYYSNVRASVSGLIDWKWLMENLDCRTESGVPFHRKMMYSSDSYYGVGEPEYVYRGITFMREFFDRVGMTYNWGNAKEDFMHGNAERFLLEKF